MALNVLPPPLYTCYVTEPTPASSPSPVPRSLDTDADATDGNDDVIPQTPEERKRPVRRRRKGRTENAVFSLELAELRRQHLHPSQDGADVVLEQPYLPEDETPRGTQPLSEPPIQPPYKHDDVHAPVYERSSPFTHHENRFFSLQDPAQIESDSQSTDNDTIRHRQRHGKRTNQGLKPRGDVIQTVSSNFPHSPLPANQFPERQYPSSPFLENPYPESEFPSGSYPVSNYPNTVMPSSTYPESGFPSSPLPGSNYPVSSYPCSSFPDSSFPSSSFPSSSFPRSPFPSSPFPHCDVADKTLR